MGETVAAVAIRPEDVLADYSERMSVYQAEKRLHLRHGQISAAIERGELAYVPAGTRYQVTPSALAEWVLEFGSARKAMLPGADGSAS